MPRPKTKSELISAAESNYTKLFSLISEMTDTELSTPFDFSNDEKKKELHWGRDKNLRDVLAHLFEWHQLLLQWVNTNIKGGNVPFLPAPYNWKTYGKMNMEFWSKHQTTELETIKKLLDKSHNDVMKLLESFDDDELFTKGKYSWVGGTSLASYFISNTSSHYDWAIKKLKAHKKKVSG